MAKSLNFAWVGRSQVSELVPGGFFDKVEHYLAQSVTVAVYFRPAAPVPVRRTEFPRPGGPHFGGIYRRVQLAASIVRGRLRQPGLVEIVVPAVLRAEAGSPAPSAVVWVIEVPLNVTAKLIDDDH